MNPSMCSLSCLTEVKEAPCKDSPKAYQISLQSSPIAREHHAAAKRARLGHRLLLSDFVLAHMWFNLAAAQGYQDALSSAVKSRDYLASQMTPAQIAEAQKLAREWQPVKQPTR
jgi:hypothetical protein